MNKLKEWLRRNKDIILFVVAMIGITLICKLYLK